MTTLNLEEKWLNRLIDLNEKSNGRISTQLRDFATGSKPLKFGPSQIIFNLSHKWMYQYFIERNVIQAKEYLSWIGQVADFTPKKEFLWRHFILQLPIY